VIPVNEPLLDGRERELLAECVDTGWISSDGPFVGAFEEGFAGYLGAAHGIAVCNGTAALEVALYAAGVGEGDEVIMPSFTIVSCAIAAVRLGARPVLVDVEPDTWCMAVDQVAAVITPRTRAIMPVHMYGHPVDLDPLLELARIHGLAVIEDAAQVHGAEYKGRKCGGIGDLGSFSFYANKILTTGEGGMVVTSDERLAERARSYRNLCFRPERRFYHTELGYNYRMTNLQAAVGVAQLERLDEFVARKRALGERYREGLGDLPGVRTQVERSWAKGVYWMYCMELDPETGWDAAGFMAELGARGIGTRPFFLGLHEQPALVDQGWVEPGLSFPVTERSARQGLYLPSGLALTAAQVDEVVATVRNVLNR
jgi:perosamine synthetase